MTETRNAALPPIANALEHFAKYLRAATMPPGQVVPAAPIRQQVAQMNALLEDVAAVERQLEAAAAELQRIKPAEEFLAICREIHGERAAQDEQWGGPGHDDGHMPEAWFGLVQRQIDRAAASVSDGPAWDRVDVDLMRTRLVKVAALAVAGVQSIDRRLAVTAAAPAGAEAMADA